MPYAAARLCSASGCPEPAIRHGRCAAHMRQEYTRVERYRGTATARGYDWQWTKLRQRVLAKRPCCVECDKDGIIQLAQEVDHITPLARGGERLSEANVQPLCRQHHYEKSTRERRT